MTTRTKGYYHCLECGALFEAELKNPSDQRCSICGHPPTGKILAGNEEEAITPSLEAKEKKPGELSPIPSVQRHGISQDSQEIYEATMTTIEAQMESRTGRVKRIKRKAKKGKRRWFFVVGWVVLMMSVIALFKIFGPNEDSDSLDQNGAAAPEKREAAVEEQKKSRMINEAIPACEKSMSEFLSATSAAAKAQHVYQGVKLSGVMNRYYRDELSFSASDSRAKIVSAELLEGFNMDAIGALCINSQGEKWEAIFIFDEDEWKIDWASLVRFYLLPQLQQKHNMSIKG